jgi:hypothetical protein
MSAPSIPTPALAGYATSELDRELLIRAVARHGAAITLHSAALEHMLAKQEKRVAELRRVHQRTSRDIAARKSRSLPDGFSAWVADQVAPALAEGGAS